MHKLFSVYRQTIQTKQGESKIIGDFRHSKAFNKKSLELYKKKKKKMNVYV